MKKVFFTNLVFLIALNAIIKIAYVFFIDRQVQNDLGSETYGTYAILFNFSFVFQFILDMGIQNFNNREISQHNHLLGKYLSQIFPLKIILGILYLLICLGLAFVWGFEASKIKMLVMLVFNQFLASFILYLRTNISGLHLFKTDAFLSILDRALIVTMGAFVLSNASLRNQYNIYWFIYAQTIGYSITFISAIIICLRHSSFFKIRLKLTFFKLILKKSSPYALLFLLMSIYFKTDTILLDLLLPNGEYMTGIYVQSFRIVEALLIFSFLFSNLLLPMFSRLLKKNEPIFELLELSLRIMLSVLIAFIIPCIFFSSSILSLLYTETHESSNTIFVLLMLALIAYSLTYIYGSLLTANGDIVTLNKIAFVAAIFSVLLNLILIPKFWAAGASISFLCSQIVVISLQAYFAKRKLEASLSGPTLLKLIGLLVFSVLIASFSDKIDFRWEIKWFLLILTNLAFVVVFKIFRLKSLFHMFMQLKR